MPIKLHFIGKALEILYIFDHFNKLLIRNEIHGGNFNHENIPNTIQVFCVNCKKTEYLV